MSECELEQLFAAADLGEPPCGCLRGHVLCFTGMKLPRARAKLAGCVWRGKCFAPDGEIVNQFPGFRAIHTHSVPAPSWYDGKPCLAVEYQPGTPLFANNRDEIRQLGPGLYLCRLYQRCPCPKLVGYLALSQCHE
jgi:hypothetical protein